MTTRLLAAGFALGLGSAVLFAQPGAIPQFDQTAVERGKTAFVSTCGFCHGSGARGGEGGPDLLRSVLVLDDEGGKQLGEFLRRGRPDKGMPSFELPPGQVSDIATFLHSQIAAAAYRRTYQILNILVGDARAGQTFFNGDGKCNTCHSPEGDLKGVGSKYEPVELQGKIVMPRASRAGGAAAGLQPTDIPIRVTVKLPSGETAEGALMRITDFDVTLRDAKGVTRTYARNGDIPAVEVKDPLQHHLDMLTRYTDRNIHDLTAYLVTLK